MNDKPKPQRPKEWRNAILCFVGANAVNAVILWVWAVLGWGLRGSTYEPGRPSSEDIWSIRFIYALLALALGMNLGIPLYYAVRRRWKIVAGFIAAWFVVPIASIIGIPLVGVVVGFVHRIF